MSDRAEKLTRIRAYLKQHKLDAVVFGTRANFAWMTGGGDNHVVSQSEFGIACAVVTARQVSILTTNIEAERIKNEEPVSGCTVKAYPWTESMDEALKKLLGSKKAAADFPVAGLKTLPGDFNAEVRAQLTPEAQRQYKSLGRDCSLAIETVARSLSVGDSGQQVEADLARHLLARGIQPFLILVAFDDRLKAYRHPTPTVNHLRHQAMLVVCGQRHGLIANLTRLVHFGPIPEDLLKRHQAACTIELALWQATQVGASWGSALKAGIDQYKKQGFAKEWELHHQGGPTGYSGRDFLVTPTEKRLIQPQQAVAWNPSITGTKTEDTFILGAENERLVVTEASRNWPTIKVSLNGETVERPAILPR
ncbi:MAG: hypothetical protein EA402_13235 [Planctomycetota bacterium]|nr:MAG: hypothetical protein EA402_13235 [Planctomycetota bacterium]